MGSLAQFWSALTPGQGTVVSGALTALGAIAAILIAGRFFSGKVKSVGEALDATKQLVEQYSQSVGSQLATMEEKANATASAMEARLGRIESDLAEFADRELPSGTKQQSQSTRDDLRDQWFAIRDALEGRAADEAIDGRTRAAYGRIDRRKYSDLVQAMKRGGDLLPNEAKMFSDALAIWQTYKNGKRIVKPEDAKRLAGIRAAVDL